jgi:hypothetical protein
MDAFALSTSLDGCTEDIRILAVVVAELKLCNVERHVPAARVVERADYAANLRKRRLDGLDICRMGAEVT